MIWPTISGKSYVGETVKSMTTEELEQLRRIVEVTSPYRIDNGFRFVSWVLFSCLSSYATDPNIIAMSRW
jgi:hypothetical protein